MIEEFVVEKLSNKVQTSFDFIIHFYTQKNFDFNVNIDYEILLTKEIKKQERTTAKREYKIVVTRIKKLQKS